MFDVGSGELLLIAIIGLLVLGPQRLPKVAAQIGKWVGQARRTATQLRRQLEREIELSELETPPKPPPPPAAPPSTLDGRPYGEIPDGPGTHADPAGPEVATSLTPEPTIHATEPSAGGDKIQN